MTDHRPPSAVAPAPLIMTALLDGQSFALLDGLRRRHFPAALNRIPAHVTLFHHLPGDQLGAIADRLAAACRRMEPLPFALTQTRFLGRGVALALACPGLVGIRAEFAAAWRDRLTAQDRQGFRPHVTLQNKVPAEDARVTQAGLAGLLPIHGTIDGLLLWHYRGGPWEKAACFPFGSERGSSRGSGADLG